MSVFNKAAARTGGNTVPLNPIGGLTNQIGFSSANQIGGASMSSSQIIADPQVNDLLEKAALNMEPLTDIEIGELRGNLKAQLLNQSNPQPVVDRYLAVLSGHPACKTIFKGLGITDDDDSALVAKPTPAAATAQPKKTASHGLGSIFAQDPTGKSTGFDFDFSDAQPDRRSSYAASTNPMVNAGSRKRQALFPTDDPAPFASAIVDKWAKMNASDYGMPFGGAKPKWGSGSGLLDSEEEPKPLFGGMNKNPSSNTPDNLLSKVIKKKGISALLDYPSDAEDETVDGGSLFSGANKRGLIETDVDLDFTDIEDPSQFAAPVGMWGTVGGGGAYSSGMMGAGALPGMMGGYGGMNPMGNAGPRGPGFMGAGAGRPPFAGGMRPGMMARGLFDPGMPPRVRAPRMMGARPPISTEQKNAVPGRGPKGWTVTMPPPRRELYDLQTHVPAVIGTLTLYKTVRRAYEYGELDKDDHKLIRDQLSRLLNRNMNPFPLVALYGSFLPPAIMQRLMRDQTKERLTESAKMHGIPPHEVKMAVTGQIPQRIPRVLRAPFEEIEATVYKKPKPDIRMPAELRKDDPGDYQIHEMPGVIIDASGQPSTTLTARTRRWLQSLLYGLIRKGTDYEPLVEKMKDHFGDAVMEEVMSNERTVKIIAKGKLHYENPT